MRMLDSHSTLATFTSSTYTINTDYRKDFMHLSLTCVKAIRNGVWRSLTLNRIGITYSRENNCSASAIGTKQLPPDFMAAKQHGAKDA